MLGADAAEDVGTAPSSAGPGATLGQVGEGHAVVGQHGVGASGNASATPRRNAAPFVLPASPRNSARANSARGKRLRLGHAADGQEQAGLAPVRRSLPLSARARPMAVWASLPRWGAFVRLPGQPGDAAAQATRRQAPRASASTPSSGSSVLRRNPATMASSDKASMVLRSGPGPIGASRFGRNLGRVCAGCAAWSPWCGSGRGAGPGWAVRTTYHGASSPFRAKAASRRHEVKQAGTRWESRARPLTPHRADSRDQTGPHRPARKRRPCVLRVVPSGWSSAPCREPKVRGCTWL